MTRKPEADVGAGIRRIRRAKSLSLREVAEQVGVSESFVSQIERGAANPSIATLHRIAQALGVAVTDFFAGSDSGNRLVRAREAPRMTRPSRNSVDVLLTPHGVRGFELMMSTVEPGSGSGDELYAHSGDEECVYVLAGSITIRTEDGSYDLEAGDVFLLDPRRPHGYENSTDSEARLLWITSPPGVRPF